MWPQRSQWVLRWLHATNQFVILEVLFDRTFHVITKQIAFCNPLTNISADLFQVAQDNSEQMAAYLNLHGGKEMASKTVLNPEAFVGKN